MRVLVLGALFALGASTTLAEGPKPPEIKAAYTAAVTWLVEVQSKDGRWDTDNWTGNQGGRNELGDSRYDVGVTALATLALLETKQPGERVNGSIQKALAWLSKQQRGDGSIGFENRHGESIYNHALATLALCKALKQKRPVKEAAQKALSFCITAQNPTLGWKYGVKSGRNDSSVTIWMLLCLKAGKAAGLEAPYKPALKGGVNWLFRATNNAGEVGYESPGGGSAYLAQNEGRFDPLPVMTAAALHALGKDAKQAEEMGSLLLEDLPSWTDDARKANFYYWYHGTLALKALGGNFWETWRAKVLGVLLDNQHGEGRLKGSWEPVAEWCLAGGRVYATAINALTLAACR